MFVSTTRYFNHKKREFFENWQPNAISGSFFFQVFYNSLNVWVDGLFQGERNDVSPENTKVYIEFIMDGVEIKRGESSTFPLKVVVDPLITDDTEDIHLYINHLPYTRGAIIIKVGRKSKQCYELTRVIYS